jgi:hypothetical protein
MRNHPIANRAKAACSFIAVTCSIVAAVAGVLGDSDLLKIVAGVLGSVGVALPYVWYALLPVHLSRISYDYFFAFSDRWCCNSANPIDEENVHRDGHPLRTVIWTRTSSSRVQFAANSLESMPRRSLRVSFTPTAPTIQVTHSRAIYDRKPISTPSAPAPRKSELHPRSLHVVGHASGLSHRSRGTREPVASLIGHSSHQSDQDYDADNDLGTVGWSYFRDLDP